MLSTTATALVELTGYHTRRCLNFVFEKSLCQHSPSSGSVAFGTESLVTSYTILSSGALSVEVHIWCALLQDSFLWNVLGMSPLG